MKEKDKILYLIESVKANTFKCDICGEIVFPEIVSAGDSNYDVMTVVASIYGGIGNNMIHKKVCQKCSKNINS